MQTTARSKLTGFWYVLPALLFVVTFTAWPFLQMVWISLNEWSLITPPSFVGLQNYLDRLRRFPVLDLTPIHPEVHAVHHPDPDDRRISHRAPGHSQ